MMNLECGIEVEREEPAGKVGNAMDQLLGEVHELFCNHFIMLVIDCLVHITCCFRALIKKKIFRGIKTG
jgi:hypothetical protein